MAPWLQSQTVVTTNKGPHFVGTSPSHRAPSSLLSLYSNFIPFRALVSMKPPR